MASSAEPLTPLQILLKALHLPSKSGKQFFPLLALSLLTSTSLLLYFTTTISPPLRDLLSNIRALSEDRPKRPDIFDHISDDLHSVAKSVALVAPPAFLSSLLIALASVSAFASAYTSKPLTLNKLASRLADRWYKTAVTVLYILVFGAGYLVLSSLVVTSAIVFSDDDAKNLTNSYSAAVARTAAGSLCSFAAGLLLYLATRGAISVVISVLEETWGIGALSWSVELFIGNKKRGFVLTTVLVGVRVAIYGALGMVIFSGDEDDDDSKFVMLGAAAVAAWELYSLAVYTVLYYECRKSHGLDDLEGKQGFIYGVIED